MDLFNWGCRKRAISGFDFSCWQQNDAATRSQQLVTSASTEREAGNVFPQKGHTDVTPARSGGRDIEHQSCAHLAVVGFDINRWAVLGNLPSTWADSIGRGVCVWLICASWHTSEKERQTGMQGGFTGVEGDGERAQVFSHYGRGVIDTNSKRREVRREMAKREE